MQVNLYKKTGKYTDRDGKEKNFVNFYVRCGDQMIPIEVSFFPNEKFDNRDLNYAPRKEVLKAFAELLPDEQSKETSMENESVKTSAK